MQQLKFFVKRRFIAFLKRWPEYIAKWHLPVGSRNLASLTESYKLIYHHCTAMVERRLPLALQPVHPIFKQQQITAPFVTSVVGVQNWRVWGNQGAVVTADNYLYADASRQFDDKVHSIFHQYKLVAPAEHTGRTAVLAASGANVYYHGMFYILPRIDILRKSGQFDQIEHFIVNYSGADFQKETLEKAGISVNKIIPSLDHWKFHIKAADLIVPSLVSPNNCPSLASCLYLRSLFLPQHGSPKQQVNIYIKRSAGRRVLNEEELIAFLEQQAFQVVSLEQMPVAQQAALFAKAKTVIGAHGSGFTNIVFCQPGTVVVDIFAPDWINPCYWIIATHLQLKYGYLISNYPNSGFKKTKNTNVQANINQLAKLLSKLHAA